MHPVVADLGAGYGNLKRIAGLEPAGVKIDIDLERNIHLHKRQQKLVRARVTRCGELGAKAMAEGIGTKDELRGDQAMGRWGQQVSQASLSRSGKQTSHRPAASPSKRASPCASSVPSCRTPSGSRSS